MATDTRSGFRLPWGTAADDSDNPSVEGVEPGAEEAQDTTMIETVESHEWPTASEEPTHPTRRSVSFKAELSRAMQAAVETARTETMTRFELEAKTVIDEIQSGATGEAASLRSKSDADVSSIRDWSKSEIARIREETEERISARKSTLEAELVDHAATIEAKTARVTTVVAAYEAELAEFFERLNAEDDPTRIAAMADTMPEPPSLADIAASVASPSEPSAERLSRLLAPAEEAAEPAIVDFAAAEAEAAAFTDDAAGQEESEPTDGEASTVEESDPIPTAVADAATTRVVVSGLISVANIANFKRGLGRLPGVSSITVASGRDGDFAFTVGHTLGPDLAAAVRSLPGFDIEITNESDGAIVVAASDREANS